MKSKSRRLKNLRRRASVKKPRARILIVCEGAKTEPNYFDFLKKQLGLSAIEVEVCGKECGSAAISVVKFAKDKIDTVPFSPKRDEYDEVWCISDVEAPIQDPTLDDAIRMAKSSGITIALSNPCFEYWYILHYRKTSPYMNKNKEVIKILKKYYPNYDKGSDDILAVIYHKTTEAINNAAEISVEKIWGTDLRKCNPSTDVYRIVERLQQISKEQAAIVPKK